MNWVGGSRSRILQRDDAKRQREFFDKMKMQQRLKTFGLMSPSSEVSTGRNTDFVSLYLANQMAVKKDKQEPPKVAVLSIGTNAVSNQRRNHPLVLPMSPCSPSKLSLVESQPRYSQTRKRRHISQLSPVMESAFSDNSASDYVPRARDSFSPSSSSSASSGQAAGQLSLLLNQSRELQPQPALFCSQPSSNSGLEHCLATDLMNSRIVSTSSDVAHLEAPSAAPVLPGKPLESEEIVNINPAFSLSNDKMPDFSLNQSEELFQENMLRSLNNGEFSLMESGVKSKIHLIRDTPAKLSRPQMGAGNSRIFLNEDQYSPSCSSSDSNDDEKKHSGVCCKTLFTMDPTCAESDQGSLTTSGQIHPFPPSYRHLQIRAEGSSFLNELNTGNNQQTFPQTQCQCWRKCTETHERGTQTENPTETEKCDFSVQCALMPQTELKPPLLHLSHPPLEAAVQCLSTRGSAVHTDGLRASPGMTGTNTEEKFNHRPFTSSRDALCGYRAKEYEEKWHEESLLVLKSPKEVKEVKSGAKPNAADDASTLQEIADILLLLKQKSGARSV